MTTRLDVVGIIVADMARSLAFYRQLGFDLPESGDAEPHVEASLPGGLRIAWDTEDTIRSFDLGDALRDAERPRRQLRRLVRLPAGQLTSGVSDTQANVLTSGAHGGE